MLSHGVENTRTAGYSVFSPAMITGRGQTPDFKRFCAAEFCGAAGGYRYCSDTDSQYFSVKIYSTLWEVAFFKNLFEE